MTVTVEDIRIYPVKALRGYSLPASDVAVWGLDHDRRWMVVKPDGKFITQRELPAMARIDAQATAEGLTLSTDADATANDGLRLQVPASRSRAAAGSCLEQ